MKTGRYIPIFIILALILLIIPPVSSNTFQDPNILLIYGNTQDREIVENMIENTSIMLTTTSISALTSADIADQDQIIFASSEEFSTDDSVENAIISYLQDKGHNFFMISPFIEEFSGELETNLGIDNIDKITDNTTQSWSINLDQSVGNFSKPHQFSYSGRATMLDLEPNSQTLASFINVTGLEDQPDLQLPRPAIWNVSRDASIHVVATEVGGNQTGLIHRQITDLFETLVQELLTVTLQAVRRDLSTVSVTSSGTPTTSDRPIAEFIPQFSLPNLGILSLLIAAIALLAFRIKSILGWITRKVYSLLFLVVGAFYNVSNRTLTHNEVITNTTRDQILSFLNHLGSYGAHLREIKSKTEQGAGSLLWHLQVLEDYGLIEQYSIDGYTVFVAQEYDLDPHFKSIELGLKSKYTLDLLEVLKEELHSSLTLTTIEQQTGQPRRAIRRLLEKLSESDIVEIDRYPKMTIQVTNLSLLKKLYQSFKLRESFHFDDSTPDIKYLE